jgi:hypothetical protein
VHRSLRDKAGGTAANPLAAPLNWRRPTWSREWVPAGHCRWSHRCCAACRVMPSRAAISAWLRRLHTGPPHAVHHDPAHRPQPADPHRLEHPARRRPAPRRQGPAPENPPPPQNPRRPGHRTTLTTHRHDHEPAPPAPKPGASTPANSTNPGLSPAGTPQDASTRAPAHQAPECQTKT